jgi:hypothetical protein
MYLFIIIVETQRKKLVILSFHHSSCVLFSKTTRLYIYSQPASHLVLVGGGVLYYAHEGPVLSLLSPSFNLRGMKERIKE